MAEQISCDLLTNLLDKAKDYYTHSYGCLVKFYGKHIRKGIDMCISSIANEKLFSPINCRIWKSETCLFAGKIDSSKVVSIINEEQICCAEVTDTKKLEYGEHGKFYCLRPDRCFARCATCSACQITEKEHAEISTDLVALWNSKLSLESKRIHRMMKAKGRKRGS